jgi:hypothetical protein
MTTPLSRATLTVALAAALLLSPVLSGCGAISGMISDATGGDVNVSFGSLPEGWPTVVPVVDGDIVAGGVVTGEDGKPSWNVTIKVSDAGVFDTVAAQLTDAGFGKVDNPAEDSVKGLTGGLFTDGTYAVVVAVTGSDTDSVVNYTVTTAGIAQ